MNRREMFAATIPVASLGLASVATQSVFAAERDALASAEKPTPAFAAFVLRFDEAEAVYRKAAAEHAAALARLLALAPTEAPDALILPPRPRLGEYLCGDLEQTPDNRIVKPSRHISTVRNLEIEMKDHGPRTAMGREVRRRLPIARAYEAAIENAREASGYSAAETARFWAALALMRLAKEAFDMPAETMADVGIKARAFLAGGYCDEGAPHTISVRHGRALAEDVAQLAGRAA